MPNPIVAVIIAALVCVLVAACVACWLERRRRRQSEADLRQCNLRVVALRRSLAAAMDANQQLRQRPPFRLPAFNRSVLYRN